MNDLKMIFHAHKFVTKVFLMAFKRFKTLSLKWVPQYFRLTQSIPGNKRQFVSVLTTKCAKKALRLCEKVWCKYPLAPI